MKKYLLFIVLLIVNINNTILSSPNSSPVINLNITWDDIDINWDESDIKLMNDLSQNFSPKSSFLKNSTLTISNSKNAYIIHDKQEYILFKIILSSKVVSLNSLMQLIKDPNYPICPEDIIVFSNYIIENKNHTNDLISTYIETINRFLEIKSNDSSIYFKTLDILKQNKNIKENTGSINICAKILNKISQNSEAPLNILIELLQEDPSNKLIYINLIKGLAKESQYINYQYGKYNQTPLILALKYNLPEIAKILIEHEANTTILDNNNRCALQFIFGIKDKHIQLELAKDLVKENKYNKNKYKSLLVNALNIANIDLAKLFIEKGAQFFTSDKSHNKYDKVSLNLFVKNCLPAFVKIYNNKLNHKGIINENIWFQCHDLIEKINRSSNNQVNKEKAINILKETLSFINKFNNGEIYDEKTINNLINLESNNLEVTRLLMPNYNEFKNIYQKSLIIKTLSYSKQSIFPPELSAKITSYIRTDQNITNDIDIKKQD